MLAKKDSHNWHGAYIVSDMMRADVHYQTAVPGLDLVYCVQFLFYEG